MPPRAVSLSVSCGREPRPAPDGKSAANSDGAPVARERLYTSDPICIGARKDDGERLRFPGMFVPRQISSGWQAEAYYSWRGTEPGALSYLW